MAKFKITNKGKALQAKVLAGKCKYEFTKIAVGDGYADSEDDYADLNDLVQRKVDVDITDIGETEGGICEISGVVTNTGMTEALYVREAGLYAKDPDEGEILFCVNYYERPSVIDVASEGAYAREFLFQIGIESGDDITVVVSQAGLVTRGTLDSILSRSLEGFFEHDADGDTVLTAEPTVSTYFILDNDNDVVMKN